MDLHFGKLDRASFHPYTLHTRRELVGSCKQVEARPVDSVHREHSRKNRGAYRSDHGCKAARNISSAREAEDTNLVAYFVCVDLLLRLQDMQLPRTVTYNSASRTHSHLTDAPSA